MKKVKYDGRLEETKCKCNGCHEFMWGLYHEINVALPSTAENPFPFKHVKCGDIRFDYSLLYNPLG